jgi:hypothetical protein
MAMIFMGGTLQWMPPRLEQVDDEAVEQYFCRMDDPRCKDLNLPSRCYNGINTESKLWLSLGEKVQWSRGWITPQLKFEESIQIDDH